jgi:GT2 family glycosyltransferase
MQKVDVIINYFNPAGSKKLLYQTLFAVACYNLNDPATIILVDGSGKQDPELSKLQGGNNFVYLFSEQPLSFAEGYNRGIEYALRNTDSEHVLLSANDIFVDPKTIERLLNSLTGEVGCAIPYLSNSDLYIQNDKFNWKPRFPAGMTLNVNLFRKADLVAINKVPEDFSGYFNDVIMAHRLMTQLKKKIILVNAGTIVHLGRATTSLSSSAHFQKDLDVFSKNYPDLALSNKILPVNQFVFAQNNIDRLIFRFTSAVDNSFVMRLEQALRRLIYKIQYTFHKLLK